jgi:Protein of unknown function (DUF2281)
MTAAERIYELVGELDADRASEVLDFAEFLHQKQIAHAPAKAAVPMPPGTLTGLRGIAKGAGKNLSDEALQADYTDYLVQKYQ